jgi:hypothetical protein
VLIRDNDRLTIRVPLDEARVTQHFRNLLKLVLARVNAESHRQLFFQGVLEMIEL